MSKTKGFSTRAAAPGIYSEWLIEHGAEVIAVDASPKMIELAKQRLGKEADIRQADLSKTLPFLDRSSFDIVLSALVLGYIEDWHTMFTEFYRILRPAEHFVFSVHHPFFDYLYFGSSNYYETELVGSEWRGFEGFRVYNAKFPPSARRDLQSAY